MRYTRLSASGPTVSIVGLGASHFGRVCNLQQTCAIVDAAIDAGVTFIDTAEAYPGSEELLGQALSGKRHRVMVSSKFGHPHNHPEGRRGSREVVRASLEGSLQRLRTEYLDVYLMHVPDPTTPLDETLEALTGLVAGGALRCFGLSNHPASDIQRARGITCVQERYNLLNRAIEADIVPVTRERGIGVVPAVPLASGWLVAGGDVRRGRTGKAMTHEVREVLENLEEFAQSRNISMVQLAVGWLAAQPGVGPVITGATLPEQIIANAGAADWQPSDEELTAIDRLSASTRRVAA